MSGEPIARVIPPARSLVIGLACGLIATETSIAAWNGELRARSSFDSSTPLASTSPRFENPATIPAATHLPRASTAVAPAGTATPAPTATTRPSRITTVPFGIGAEPSPIATVPPVMAIVCAAAGVPTKAAASRSARFT